MTDRKLQSKMLPPDDTDLQVKLAVTVEQEIGHVTIGQGGERNILEAAFAIMGLWVSDNDPREAVFHFPAEQEDGRITLVYDSGRPES